MRKTLLLIFWSSFLFAGCAIVPAPEATNNAPAVVINRGPLPEASLGMRREEIVKLLDRQVIVGYEKDPSSGEFHPLRAKALYSTEVLEIGGIAYQVDLYIVSDVKTAAPGEQDLLPLIYQKGVLVGKGISELEALKARGK